MAVVLVKLLYLAHPARGAGPVVVVVVVSGGGGGELFLGLQDGAAVVVEGLLQLLVGVDQAFHGVVVGARILGGHVGLDALCCAGAALGEFFDEVVGEDLGGGGAGDDLLEELG